MGISRTKQKVQKDYTWLGVDLKYVENIVRCAKGISIGYRSLHFYEQFLNLRFPVIGMVDTVDEVREVLQDAWWVEEEDIRQQCYMWMYSMGHNITTYVAPKYLFMYVRDWLLLQKVFQRHTDWEGRCGIETNPTCELPQQQPDVRILFNSHPFYDCEGLSLYHRYMLYCFSQGCSVDRISELTRQQPRAIHKEVVRLRELMEEEYGHFRQGVS